MPYITITATITAEAPPTVEGIAVAAYVPQGVPEHLIPEYMHGAYSRLNEKLQEADLDVTPIPEDPALNQQLARLADDGGPAA